MGKYSSKIMEYLLWDSSFFSLNSYKCRITKEEELDDVVETLKNEDDCFITIINIDNSNEINYKIPQVMGCYSFLADVNINMKKDISANCCPYKGEEKVGFRICNNAKFDEKVVELTSNFKYSRFFNDSRLGEVRFELYKNWVMNAFENQDKFFVFAENEERVVGFLLFSINDDGFATVELVVVSDECQGQGIGTMLFCKMENYLAEIKINTVYVGTQVSNRKALNFYIHQGYKINQVNSIYHVVKRSVVHER